MPKFTSRRILNGYYLENLGTGARLQLLQSRESSSSILLSVADSMRVKIMGADQNRFLPVRIECPYVSTIRGGHLDHQYTLCQSEFTKRLQHPGSFLQKKISVMF